MKHTCKVHNITVYLTAYGNEVNKTDINKEYGYTAQIRVRTEITNVTKLRYNTYLVVPNRKDSHNYYKTTVCKQLEMDIATAAYTAAM